MSKLHDTLTEYVLLTKAIPEPDTEEQHPKTELFRKAVVEQMETEIIEEIVQQEAEAIQERWEEKRNARFEQERRQRAIRKFRDAKMIFWTVIVLGVLLSLMGNQLTELFGMVKGTVTKVPPVPLMTFGALLLLAVLVGIVYKVLYLDGVVDAMEEFDQKGSEQE